MLFFKISCRYYRHLRMAELSQYCEELDSEMGFYIFTLKIKDDENQELQFSLKINSFEVIRYLDDLTFFIEHTLLQKKLINLDFFSLEQLITPFNKSCLDLVYCNGSVTISTNDFKDYSNKYFSLYKKFPNGLIYRYSKQKKFNGLSKENNLDLITSFLISGLQIIRTKNIREILEIPLEKH